MNGLRDLRSELIRITQLWAAGQEYDPVLARQLRYEIVRLNHAHYLENIPVYRKLAREEGVGEDADVETIKQKMMLDAGIFKSYDQAWLDNGDYGGMTRWLSGMYHRPVETDMSGVTTIDGWIERLGASGIHVVYSSGTSGSFSFVPREKQDWERTRTANIACLAPLLARYLGGGFSHRLLQPALRLMTPEALSKMTAKRGLPGFDAAFLGFRRGGMGNQVLIEELAPLFRRHYYLYDIGVTGNAIRCLRRGAGTDEERQLIEGLRDVVIGNKETNCLRLMENIRQSTEDGQKVFIFGAPYQFRELCEVIAGHNRRLVLKEGSLVLFGGGWKTFTGEALDREALVDIIVNTLGVSPEQILEGYSMTEINVLLLRCEYGRFHIPPIIEPVVLDEALNPVEGGEVEGAFGFLDPLAVSYPGFLVSGDHVRMGEGECPCGLTGPAIMDIGRLPGAEVKGCGGIMGSIRT